MEYETEYYKPEELAIKLNVSKKWVTNWTQKGKIPGQVKLGHAWRYKKTEVEKALLRGDFLEH